MAPVVTAPSQQQVEANPRCYALLQQILTSKDRGEDAEQVFGQLLASCGSQKAVPADGELSFEQFCSLFTKPSTEAESGEGNCVGYATQDATGHLQPWRFTRRDLRSNDVCIQITHAGICHSDIHQARNEWGGSLYPMVPGHEIAGIVTQVGPNVKKFKVGEQVGVGCLVNSCKKCKACTVQLEEQFCETGAVATYNGKDYDGAPTFGGYSSHVVVDQSFVLHVPNKLSLRDAAPLLCAGITVYSPIRTFGFDKPGMNIGVVGLGGLGHMAVKILVAMGVSVTVISTSTSKQEDAKKLGAQHFVVSKDEEQMKAAANTLDGIVDTVSSRHDLNGLLNLMKIDRTMVMVGMPAAEAPSLVPTYGLIYRRQRIAGSPIGGIKQTQEMLDFCAEHGIVCQTELIPADYVNKAYERVLKSDVRYRFVIDVQGTLIA